MFEKKKRNRQTSVKVIFCIFLFKSDKKLTIADTETKAVFGENTISVRSVQKYFSKFNDGNFEAEDATQIGTPNSLCLRVLVECKQNQL